MSTKLIVGFISGAGALGGVVAGSYYLLNKEAENPNKKEQLVVKKTLKEELSGADFEALDTTEGAEKANWKKLVDKYNSADTTTQDKIPVEGTIQKTTTDQDASNIKILQTACSKLLAKKDGIVENDKKIAKNWCNKKSTLIAALG